MTDLQAKIDLIKNFKNIRITVYDIVNETLGHEKAREINKLFDDVEAQAFADLGLSYYDIVAEESDGISTNK